MTRDEKWVEKCIEVKGFIEAEHRNPSHHSPEERGRFCNWIKHNRKIFNAGELKPDRMEAFKELIALMEENKRLNQYR